MLFRGVEKTKAIVPLRERHVACCFSLADQNLGNVAVREFVVLVVNLAPKEIGTI